MSTQPLATPDTPQVLLEHHLKALRLPTFLREYDKMARQCAEEKTDFPRFGPIVGRRGSENACRFLSTPLKTCVLRVSAFGS